VRSFAAAYCAVPYRANSKQQASASSVAEFNTSRVSTRNGTNAMHAMTESTTLSRIRPDQGRLQTVLAQSCLTLHCSHTSGPLICSNTRCQTHHQISDPNKASLCDALTAGRPQPGNQKVPLPEAPGLQHRAHGTFILSGCARASCGERTCNVDDTYPFTTTHAPTLPRYIHRWAASKAGGRTQIQSSRPQL
jgi:hypothetical protein